MVIFVCGALWRKHAMQAMWYSSPGFDSHLKALSLKGEDEKLILKGVCHEIFDLQFCS